MEKLRFWVLCFVSALYLFGCQNDEPKPEVTANFEFEQDANDPKKLTFNNLSKHFASVTWNFGDGTALSHEESPVHTFASDGSYTVKLTATGSDGTIAEKTEIIALPHMYIVANFEFQRDTVASRKVDFNNLSRNYVSISWNFGDGTPLSHEVSPSHTFGADGTYTVKMTATGKEGEIAEKTEIIVLPHPHLIANFEFQKDEADLRNVIFTNLSKGHTSSTWNFGDGSPLSHDNAPSHIFSSGGTYIVKLTVHAENGEIAEKTEVVTVTSDNMVADFVFVRDELNFRKINFTNLSKNYASLSWNFADGSPLQNEINPEHMFPGEGSYNVKLTVRADNGSMMEKSEIVVIVDPALGESHTVEITPDGASGKDALLHGLWSEVDKNYGNNPQFAACAWTVQGIPFVLRSVIQFDLSMIPANAVVTEAYLSLYAWDSDGGLMRHSTLSGSNETWIVRVTSSWNENTVTWNTQPGATTLHQVLIPASISDTENYLDIDVTQLVQDMQANPANSFGFMIRLKTEEYYRNLNFCSSDHANPALHPKLVVKYISR